MKLHQIKAFLAVLEQGSLRAAAAHLKMTQPALTKSLRQLEEELGVTLFERSIRGMQATSYGRAFAPRARVVETELRRGIEEIRQMKGLLGGQVSVGVSPSPAVQLLPQVLRRFQARQPEVSLRIIDGQYPFVLPFLRDGSVDFVVGPQPSDGLDAEFTAEELYVNPNAIICRAGHPLAHAESVHDLRQVEWLLPSLNKGPSIAVFELFRAHGLEAPTCRLTCEMVMATQTLVAKTDMMTILPLGALLGQALRPDLIQVCIRETLPAYPICIITRTGQPLTSAAQELANTFRRTMVSHTP